MFISRQRFDRELWVERQRGYQEARAEGAACFNAIITQERKERKDFIEKLRAKFLSNEGLQNKKHYAALLIHYDKLGV